MEIKQDLSTRPRNTSNGRFTSATAPLSTSRVMYIIFPVFVENIRTVILPSGKFGIMFFINANTGTPEEMIPQFIL